MIVSIHGGAFVRMRADTFAATDAGWSINHECVVVSVDYRLAPEDPFPAGPEDCYAVLCWVAAHAEELSIDVDRLVVAGGSAGGALTAAVTLMARDRGGPKIAFQGLMIPVLDDRLDTPSMRQAIEAPGFNSMGAEGMWLHYLGETYDRSATSPYAAPSRAEDLSGLPPAFIQTNGLDPLRDEGIHYALRLLAAGVSVELCNVPGVYHGAPPLNPAAAARAEPRVQRRAARSPASGRIVDTSMTATPPLPHLTPWNRYFWTSGADGVLRIQQCHACERLLHPPLPRCPDCRSDDLGDKVVSGRGVIEAVTVNHQPWHPAFDPPYVIAIVALAEDPAVRLTTNIVNCAPDDAVIGLPVRVVFERRDDVWMPLFEPDPDAAPTRTACRCADGGVSRSRDDAPSASSCGAARQVRTQRRHQRHRNVGGRPPPRPQPARAHGRCLPVGHRGRGTAGVRHRRHVVVPGSSARARRDERRRREQHRRRAAGAPDLVRQRNGRRGSDGRRGQRHARGRRPGCAVMFSACAECGSRRSKTSSVTARYERTPRDEYPARWKVGCLSGLSARRTGSR